MTTRLPKHVRTAIWAVVSYNWSDELDDYAEHVEELAEARKELGPLPLHIFEHLVVLENWLRGTAITPEEFVASLRRKGKS